MARHRPLALAALLAVACGGTPAAPPRPPPVPPVAAPAKPTFPGAPATQIGDQLAWVLDAIVQRHGKLERAELDRHFHPSFYAAVPADQLRAIFEQLGPTLAGAVIGEVKATDDQLVARVTAGEARLRISLALDAKARTITGLRIDQDPEALGTLPTFDEARRQTAALAPHASFLVAELDHGACRPLHDLGASEPLAIGSTFKLYILLGLVDRILAGKASWNDELAIRDDWKSLPSGITQNEPPGTKRTLATLAERMISISDNTAADHLLYYLGRKQIEAALRSTQHARPALDVPLLSTRELFVLKLGAAPAELDRYLKLPEAGRRAYLDTTLARSVPHVERAADWKTARRIDSLEWFASSLDLCRAMATLHARAQDAKAAALLEILGKNPGLPIDRAVWPYVGFKGGAEPGVINLTYLLRRRDDRWFVISLGFNAAEGGALEDAKIFALATSLIALAGASD